MTRSFPVPITYTPCKRIRMGVGTMVIPIIKANRPVFERRDDTRVCVTRLMAADIIRMYRDKSHTRTR